MDINKFWAIVDQCKDAEHPELAVAELLDGLPIEEVMEFGYYLEWMEIHAFRADIWCAAYLLNGGCGDDGFTYFIRGLIAQGRDLFERTLKNPEHLQVLWGNGDIEAYAKKMGISTCEALELISEKVGATNFDLYIDGQPFVRPEMDEWDFEDEIENRKRLPELSQLYYQYWKDKPESDVHSQEILTARTE